MPVYASLQKKERTFSSLSTILLLFVGTAQGELDLRSLTDAVSLASMMGGRVGCGANFADKLASFVENSPIAVFASTSADAEFRRRLGVGDLVRCAKPSPRSADGRRRGGCNAGAGER